MKPFERDRPRGTPPLSIPSAGRTGMKQLSRSLSAQTCPALSIPSAGRTGMKLISAGCVLSCWLRLSIPSAGRTGMKPTREKINERRIFTSCSFHWLPCSLYRPFFVLSRGVLQAKTCPDLQLFFCAKTPPSCEISPVRHWQDWRVYAGRICPLTAGGTDTYFGRVAKDSQ